MEEFLRYNKKFNIRLYHGQNSYSYMYGATLKERDDREYVFCNRGTMFVLRRSEMYKVTTTLRSASVDLFNGTYIHFEREA